MMLFSALFNLRNPVRLAGLFVLFNTQLHVAGFSFSGSPDGCLSTLPTTAVAGTVVTIADQESLTSIVNCTSISDAQLNISTFPGDFILPNLVNFSGLITAQDAFYPSQNTSTLTSVSLPRLEGVFGGITLEGIASLKTLDLPFVNHSTQGIALVALPNLSSLNMSSLTGSEQALGIEGVGIESLSLNLTNTSQVQVETGGIGPKIFQLNGKPNITTDLLAIVDQFSYDGVSVGGGFEAAGASQLSLPNLESVGSSFTIVNGTFDRGYGGAISLETVGGFFVLANNTMNQTDFTNLKTVNGGFRVMNNTGLRSVVTDARTGTGGFPVLHTVVDDITISGNFTNFTLPQLASVGGGFSFTTTDPSFDCSAFDGYHSQGIIKGPYNCQVGVVNNPTSTNTTSVTQPSTSPSTTHLSKHSSGLSKGAKIGVGVGVSIAILILLVPALWFSLLRKRSRKTDEPSTTTEWPSEMGGESRKMAELEYNVPIPEMDKQRNKTELPVEEEPKELDTGQPVGYKKFSWAETPRENYFPSD